MCDFSGIVKKKCEIKMNTILKQWIMCCVFLRGINYENEMV